MYWMPKLKHSNTYLDRRLIEGKDLDRVGLAYLALKMMSRDFGTRFNFVKVIVFLWICVVLCAEYWWIITKINELSKM